MIELFTHKQIRCEHCEFEFFFTGFGSTTKIVCPACGEENTLSPPQSKPVVSSIVDEPKPEFSEFLSLSVTEKPVLCSVERCPLLTGDESGHVIIEQMGLRLRKKKNRRQTILTWTVTFQVCILIGVILFVTKTLLIPKESPVFTTAADTSTEEKKHIDTSPLVYADSLPVLAEVKIVPNNIPNNNDFFVPIVEPECVVPPLETVQEILLPPVQESPSPVEVPIVTPNLLSVATSHTQESTLPLPPVAEPSEAEPVTLEMADDLLISAKTTLTTDPESSVKQAVQAANIYEQLGQPFPDSMYWILGNAFALLSWGEPLLESAPAIETMTLSSDNRYLLAQLKDKTVWLWDVQSSASVRGGYLLDSGTEKYIKFVFTPDLHWIIGGQTNGTIRIWDMSLRNPADTVITFTERIPDLQDLQISPNGQWLAAFGRSSQGVSLAGKRQSVQPIQQVNYQRSDRFNPSDSSLYPVLLWNLRQMEGGVVPTAMVIPSLPHPVQVIRFSPNSDRIAIGRKDAVVLVYDLTLRGINEEPFILRGHQLSVTQIVFAPNGQWIATGSQDNTVRLWNLTSSKASPESATLYGHLGWISTLTIDQTGEYIFSGSYDRTIRIWNVKNNRIGTALKEESIVLETNLGVLESLSITRDGDKLIALGNEGCLGIYHLPSMLRDESAGNFRAVTFHNSGLSISKFLVTTDDQLLIFSYEHLSNPLNSGIRLWALQPQPFVR